MPLLTVVSSINSHEDVYQDYKNLNKGFFNMGLPIWAKMKKSLREYLWSPGIKITTGMQGLMDELAHQGSNCGSQVVKHSGNDEWVVFLSFFLYSYFIIIHYRFFREFLSICNDIRCRPEGEEQLCLP